MIKWEKINKIEEIEPTSSYVYDFTVPKTEIFGNADGVFVHNSVVLDSQKWMLLQTKLMGLVTETYRFKELLTIICLPNFKMLANRVREVTHAVVKMFGKHGSEARVYRLKPTGYGAQYIAGVGVLKNIKLPCYEQCKRGSCRGCKKYKSCMLLRGQYERKKAEAFGELLDYAEWQIKRLALERVVSPYSFHKQVDPDVDELVDDEDE